MKQPHCCHYKIFQSKIVRLYFILSHYYVVKHTPFSLFFNHIISHPNLLSPGFPQLVTMLYCSHFSVIPFIPNFPRIKPASKRTCFPFEDIWWLKFSVPKDKYPQNGQMSQLPFTPYPPLFPSSSASSNSEDSVRSRRFSDTNSSPRETQSWSLKNCNDDTWMKKWMNKNVHKHGSNPFKSIQIPFKSHGNSIGSSHPSILPSGNLT